MRQGNGYGRNSSQGYQQSYRNNNPEGHNQYTTGSRTQSQYGSQQDWHRGSQGRSQRWEQPRDEYGRFDSRNDQGGYGSYNEDYDDQPSSRGGRQSSHYGSQQSQWDRPRDEYGRFESTGRGYNGGYESQDDYRGGSRQGRDHGGYGRNQNQYGQQNSWRGHQDQPRDEYGRFEAYDQDEDYGQGSSRGRGGRW